MRSCVPWLVLLLLCACNVDDAHKRCQGDGDCDVGEECYLGYCVSPLDAASRESAQTKAPDAGRKPRAADSSKAGQGGRGGKQEDAGPEAEKPDDDAGQPHVNGCDSAMSCYTGPDKTRDVGRCKSGQRPCKDNALGACTGSVVPREEACDNEGSDDDCDGTKDNVRGRGDACTPDGAAAMCGGGTRECMSGQRDLVCVAKKMPAAESCNQMDDDCDGKTDETFNLQTDAANCGSCGHACANNQACCAGSCAMRRTDTMTGCGCTGNDSCAAGQACCNGGCKSTQTDTMNCGACGHACNMGETCCAGACVDTRSNAANCGRCGATCTRGAKPTCCNGNCTDTTTDENNCGRCGAECGVLCSCGPQNGNGVCTTLLGGSC